MKVLFLFISWVLMFSNVSISDLKAEDQLGEEYKNMEQMMGAIRLEKKEVESMVDKLVTSGRISAEDGSRAKRELASLKEDDLESLKLKAIAEVKNKKLLDK